MLDPTIKAFPPAKELVTLRPFVNTFLAKPIPRTFSKLLEGIFRFEIFSMGLAPLLELFPKVVGLSFFLIFRHRFFVTKVSEPGPCGVGHISDSSACGFSSGLRNKLPLGRGVKLRFVWCVWFPRLVVTLPQLIAAGSRTVFGKLFALPRVLLI